LASLNESDRLLNQEQQVLQRAQQGDREAFTVLVERYWDGLYRWLYHLTHHRQTAEDLAQETFLKAFAGLASFRPGTNFRAWLFRIGHNNWVNQRRTARVREPLPDEVPSRSADPADQAMQREALHELTRAVQRLPAEWRAALLLRVQEELSFRQIAEVLGLTEETARWRVFKARQKLLSLLPATQEREKS
jgi:RNA polymerase sigma-70 factor (ECF subfamily)